MYPVNTDILLTLKSMYGSYLSRQIVFLNFPTLRPIVFKLSTLREVTHRHIPHHSQYRWSPLLPVAHMVPGADTGMAGSHQGCPLAHHHRNPLHTGHIPHPLCCGYRYTCLEVKETKVTIKTKTIWVCSYLYTLQKQKTVSCNLPSRCQLLTKNSETRTTDDSN